LLQAVSRSFYLSLRLLPKEVRSGMSVAYLLARATDSIADSLSPSGNLGTPDNARALLDDFLPELENAAPSPAYFAETAALADLVSHPGEKELLKRLPEAFQSFRDQPAGDQERIRKVLHTIISGQQMDMIRFPNDGSVRWLENDAALLDYAYRVAGCVGEFWTEMLAANVPAWSTAPLSEMAVRGRRYGQGLQLVNILRDVPKDLSLGRCYLPWPGKKPPTLADLQQLRPLWTNNARELLLEGKTYAAALRGWRSRFTADLPWRIGMATLEKLEKSTDLSEPTKITRGHVKRLLLRALWFAFTGK
jgi:farnesyl-diphosphate farnesyltransferase